MVARLGFYRTLSVIVLLVALVGPLAKAQNPAPQPPQGATGAQAVNQIRPDYVLGPNDQVLIRAPQIAEINDRPVRIDADGFIELPIIGRIRAGGLTVQGLENELITKLREYILNPQVFITPIQFRSDPVFLVGAFRTPGIYPLQGKRTLVEMLTSAGGTQPNASRRIKITRRLEYGPLPLPNAAEDSQRKLSTVEISLDSLTQNINPEEDILLQPYDVISVERAERIYVSGEVGKVSSIELGERNSISIAQALTEAGGFTQYAKNEKIRVLRPISGTNRRAEIVLDAKQVFEGRAIDFPLLPNDVVFVPRATGRAIATQVGTTSLTTLPYILVTLLVNHSR